MKQEHFARLTSVTTAALLTVAACGSEDGSSGGTSAASEMGPTSSAGMSAGAANPLPPGDGSDSASTPVTPTPNATPPGVGMVTEGPGAAEPPSEATPPSTAGAAATTEPPVESEQTLPPEMGTMGDDPEETTEDASNVVPEETPPASSEMPVDEMPAVPAMESEEMSGDMPGEGSEEDPPEETPAEEAVDTWDNFAQDFFVSYCGPCHEEGGAGAGGGLYANLEDVMEDADPIACGTTLSEQYREERGCNYGRSAGQFPAGNGPQPTEEERERLIAWIDAGMP